MPANSMAQRLLPQLRRAARAHDAESGDEDLLATFVANRDGDSFAAIVRRHGPMVLGVCRRVIGDAHLAEDAFQATFLVLARRADTVRPRQLVGSWLYGVAYRTALKARGLAIRRRAREKQVDAMPHPAISPEEAWADLQPVLDRELARLPDKYRIPIILCDLGGRSQRDVARELKLPAATLANRLAAARRLLAKRLTDRGIVLSTAAVTAALGWHSATSAVPPTLEISTIRAACAAATGAPVGLPAPIIELSEGIIRMFVLNKLRTVTAGIVTCLVLLAGLGLVADPSLRANPEEKTASPKSPPAVKATPNVVEESEDAKFLRRTSVDMRGVQPTTLEMHYFLADRDAKKRTKVVEWMLSEHGVQKVTAQCAKCHQTGNTAEEVAAFLGAIYRNADPHHYLNKVEGHGDAYALFVQRVIETTDDTHDAELALAKIDVERSKKKNDAAQFKLQAVEAEAKRLKNAESQVKHDQAQLELFEAQIQLKQAEAKLAQAESTSRKYYLRLKSKTALKEEGDASDLDIRIRAAWALLRAPESPSDSEFLRRASLDLRGVLPTVIEQNYFAADKDPKKREKLLALFAKKYGADTPRDKFINELLADPAVQARWMEIWKQRLEKEQIEKRKQRDLLESWIRKKGDRLDELLNELLSSKKSDEQTLEALCLATVARFPSSTEKKVILDGLKTQPDRTAAWNGVLRALASTEEAKSHAEGLTKRGAK